MEKNSLRYYRKRARFTQESLAEETGFGASTIGNIETGKTTASKEFWDAMAKALRISSQDLQAPLISMPGNSEPLRYEDVSVVREEAEPPYGDTHHLEEWKQRALNAEAKLDALTAAMEALLNQFRRH